MEVVLLDVSVPVSLGSDLTEPVFLVLFALFSLDDAVPHAWVVCAPRFYGAVVAVWRDLAFSIQPEVSFIRSFVVERRGTGVPVERSFFLHFVADSTASQRCLFAGVVKEFVVHLILWSTLQEYLLFLRIVSVHKQNPLKFRRVRPLLCHNL